MYDLIIRGGTVIDGTGGPGRPADIGVNGGAIRAVGDLADAEARITLDATGKTIAPGFIDMHSHSDLSLPVHNRAESTLLQGITTEVIGSCGWSMAPLKQEIQETLIKGLFKSLIGLESLNRLDARWRSFGEYLDHLERIGIGANVVPLVGQSLIRAHVVGREKRPPTRGEMAAMKDLLRASMDEGAFGFSTGRAYLPGGNARTEEIIELAKVLHSYDGIYTSHIRNESDELLDAVAEVIRIGREAGIKVEVSHHKAIGPANFGKVKESLAMIDRAREEGVAINADVYPYAFAQVYPLASHFTLESEDTDPKGLTERLKDREKRAALRAKLEEAARERGRRFMVGANYVVISAPRHRDLEGGTLEDGAKRAGQDLFDFCADLLLEAEMKVNVAARMDESDVRTVLRHPLVMVGTDAFAIDAPLGDDAPIHPRHYGTFPRVLGHYARDLKLLALEEMVAKVTGRPAAKLGLTDRGLIKEGYAADLVVFDQEAIIDRATAADPYAPPVGIDWVIVNGQVAVDHGRRTDALAGRVLRRP